MYIDTYWKIMKNSYDPGSGYQTGPRIEKFIDHKKERKADFQRKTGVDRSLMTRAFSQERDLGLTSLEKIGKAYPELSLDWVITGEGEMLQPEKLSEEMDEIINQYKSIKDENGKDRLRIQVELFERELAEMKILKSTADDYLNIDDQFNLTISERLQERLLWLHYLRRERWKRHLESLQVMDAMFNGKPKDDQYSGQLSKPIKLKDSINKIDKRIKEFIFLKSLEIYSIIS